MFHVKHRRRRRHDFAMPPAALLIVCRRSSRSGANPLRWALPRWDGNYVLRGLRVHCSSSPKRTRCAGLRFGWDGGRGRRTEWCVVLADSGLFAARSGDRALRENTAEGPRRAGRPRPAAVPAEFSATGTSFSRPLQAPHKSHGFALPQAAMLIACRRSSLSEADPLRWAPLREGRRTRGTRRVERRSRAVRFVCGAIRGSRPTRRREYGLPRPTLRRWPRNDLQGRNAASSVDSPLSLRGAVPSPPSATEEGEG